MTLPWPPLGPSPMKKEKKKPLLLVRALGLVLQ